jgi:hypothetical protein
MTGAVLVLLVNSACATFDPYISDGDLTTGDNYEAVKEKALNIAADMDGNITELEYYDFGTGVIVLAAGITAASIAMFDGSRDAIVASGIAGASAGAARIFVPFQERKEIYLRGSAALRCAASATDFGALSDGGGGDLESLSGRASAVAGARPLDTIGGNFQSVSNGLNGLLSASPFAATLAKTRISRTQRAMLAASDAMEDAVSAIGSVKTNRAKILETAVRAVVVSVNGQIMNSRLDPDGALTAAAQEIEKATSEIEKKAEELTEKSEDVIDEAGNVQETATLTAAFASGAGHQRGDLTAASMKMAEQAAIAEDIADQMRDVAAEMLRVANLAKPCFKGLIR